MAMRRAHVAGLAPALLLILARKNETMSSRNEDAGRR
jgi:hypothetical protein